MISFRPITHSKKSLLFCLATWLLILECAFLFVIPLTQRDPTYIANIQFNAPFETTGPLTAVRTVSQVFSPTFDGFTTLDIYTTTFNRTNTATLILDLLYKNSSISHQEIDTKNLKDNEFYSFSLPFQPSSKDEIYTLTITSPDGTEDNGIALRYGHPPAISNSTLLIDAQAIDATLFIVPRYKISSFQYLSKLAQRININKGGVLPIGTPFIIMGLFFFVTNLFLISFTEAIHNALGRFPHIAQMMRYLIVGGSAATIELITFLLLFYNNFWYLWANIAAFALAATYGFFLQKFWTFKNYQHTYHIQAAKNFTITGIAFLLSNFLIFLFIDLWGWHAFMAKFIQLWLVLLWNYSGQKWWAFKHHDKN